MSAADRRTYKRSDRIAEVQLPNTRRLREGARALERAMLSEQRAAVERAAAELCSGITRAIGAPPVRVKVLAKRPRQADGELHGSTL